MFWQNKVKLTYKSSSTRTVERLKVRFGLSQEFLAEKSRRVELWKPSYIGSNYPIFSETVLLETDFLSFQRAVVRYFLHAFGD